MSKTTIPAGGITDSAVTTAKINADAITGAKIADDAINSEHYTDASIDTAHIGDSQVTSAKTSGVGGTNTPLFLASMSANQQISDQTHTKIQMGREVLDSGSKYDTSNYRFTPGETGYYTFQICVTTESGLSASVACYVYLYKNGSHTAINPLHSDITSASGSFNTFFIDQATNANDYYEAYIWQNKGSNVDLYESSSSALTYWMGHKLIS